MDTPRSGGILSLLDVFLVNCLKKKLKKKKVYNSVPTWQEKAQCCKHQTREGNLRKIECHNGEGIESLTNLYEIGSVKNKRSKETSSHLLY